MKQKEAKRMQEKENKNNNVKTLGWVAFFGGLSMDFFITGMVVLILLLLISLFVVESKEQRVNSSFSTNFSILINNSSDTFLILRAHSFGVKDLTIPVIIVIFNLFYALLVVLSEILSDKNGVYYFPTEGVAKSLITRIVEENKRGTAFSLYNTSVGLLSESASFVAG